MLFFGKSGRDEEYSQAIRRLETGLKEAKESLAAILRQEEAGTEAMGLWQETAGRAAERIGNLEERQQELERQIRRQSDSFEDLLEEIQEGRSLEESLKQERREHGQKEQALLSLIMCCREQMELLEKQIRKDESMEEGRLAAWKQQFHTMAQERQRLMRPCGLEETGQAGDPVDYEIHEVLSVEETGDATKAGTVARVYSCGFLQGGRVIKKARVAAYRQKSQETA